MKAKRIAWAILIATVFSGTANAQPQTGPWEKYLWQTSRTTDISASASNLVTELRAEVQKILDAGLPPRLAERLALGR